ncbi:uncharacterized protein MYCFIDRAFT_29063 [Pseudocercospora fijiensis CIRAD86]|uniref:Asparaginase n=1 Tax=Pseudocercospora fijiensis (strain CIRAD86) TaxID=383855 RepID=N1Q8Z2_PSEFD|nr:uncharacterized protein MYCFIDRAFT_29063 [Pseudocercospora fijiensis CIRAD86]EME89360.1 hypothetical protein MYCFIDRAFT_29063 [Pseudocercospora fijiensis CIRAD86]
MEYKPPSEASEKPGRITPRIIIHGGAGNITRQNMPRSSYKAYRYALLDIVESAHLELLKPGTTALDIAVGAVVLLEQNPLFNAGKGAVYTTAGTHELEASVMVTRGYVKRGVGVMKVKKAKSPIKLAREMLIRGNEIDGGGGAQGHCQLEGDLCDELNDRWGLESVRPSYFWTRRRWDEHRRGLGLSHDDETYERMKRDADALCSETSLDHARADETIKDSDPMMFGDTQWDGKEYLPQGTVGAVVLDSTGTLCAATSTGGLTNKLPGRIGDTPTLGAGFWAEQWYSAPTLMPTAVSPLSQLLSLLGDCIPNLQGYNTVHRNDFNDDASALRAVAMSGTGNGDSFLRVNAVRTCAAIARYADRSTVPLQSAVTAVAGPNGQLQQSAADRWQKTGEGEGGIIGIELSHGEGHVVFDYNCGGMFHAWIDTAGHPRFKLFQNDKGFKYE